MFWATEKKQRGYLNTIITPTTVSLELKLGPSHWCLKEVNYPFRICRGVDPSIRLIR